MHERGKALIRRAAILSALAAALCVAVRRGTPCLFRRYTGLICPSCGMSRAWLAAFHLELREAFEYHPMFWAIPVFAAFFLLGERALTKWGKVLLLGLLLAYFACYCVRLLDDPGGNTVFWATINPIII